MNSLKSLLAGVGFVFLGACAGPVTSGMDVVPGMMGDAAVEASPDSACVSPASILVFQPGHEGVMDVSQSVDSLGWPWQEATVYLATSEDVWSPMHTSASYGMTLFVNDQRQASTVSNGRATGYATITPVSASEVLPGPCGASYHYWRVEIGFSTLAETNLSPAFSQVGHQLFQGQELTMRFDLCDEHGTCLPGRDVSVRANIGR